MTPASVLVVRLGALGDVANTLPAVAALRARLPAARIGWLVEPPARDLVACAHVADEILVFPRPRLEAHLRRPWRWIQGTVEALRFLRDARARRYDTLLDMQGNFKSGALGRCMGAPRRIGFARDHGRELNWLFSTQRVQPPSPQIPRAEKALALARALVPDLQPAAVNLEGSPADRARVDELLAALPSARRLILLHPGVSDFGRFKRWPADRFGVVARRLAATLDALCLVTRGPGESALAESVAAASDGHAHVAPLLAIGQLIELFKRSDLLIAGDTGPLHIAAILGRPVVAIFGPKDPDVYRPWTERAVVVRKDLACSPCTRRACDHVRCLLEITPDDVALAAERLCGASGPEGSSARRS